MKMKVVANWLDPGDSESPACSFKTPELKNLERGLFLCLIDFFQALLAFLPPMVSNSCGVSIVSL